MMQGITNSQAHLYEQTASTQKSSNIGRDEFLKLLTLQLKHQNPLKPYDNQEFASQLALFSQLEQLTDIRALLEEQLGVNQLLANNISNSALPGLLGKTASVGTRIFKFDGENNVPIGYNLPGQAISATVEIRDSSGNLVRTITLKELDLTSGSHKIKWDGKDDNGNVLPAGNYNVKVVASSKNGSSFTADTFTYGKIQAVRFKPEGTVLVINDIEVAIYDVIDVQMEN